jgi:cellulose synthase/poly-beta-1,6-N-acetylglucosamine synthase-like glycosyltransferase
MPIKPSVSIGVPAYNEEANIVQLAAQLLTQKQDNFDLLEIIIVSDGSTDRTVAQAESIRDPRIKIISKHGREGQAEAQNEIIRIFKGDILVLLNADTYLPNDAFLSRMVEPLLADERIGIVGARVVPMPAQNFFEKTINASVAVKTEIYEQINRGDNIYLCHGRGRAFSKRFVVHLHFPRMAGEDAYSYIQCIEHGFSFYYQRQAELLYRSPQTLRDHLKQSKRFFKAKSMWDSHFKRHNRSYYHIPLKKLIHSSFKHFIQHPILLTYYSLIYILARINALWYQTTSLWEVSLTSKSVIK